MNEINFLKERRVENLKEVIVFGAGYYGIILIYLLQKRGINVVECIDNNPQKKDLILCGSVICKQPHYEKDIPIIISSKNEDVSESIYIQCSKLGYTEIIFPDFDVIDAALYDMADKEYLDIIYATKFNGKRINWNNPQTFNEKLQWLKLYDRNPEYIKLVDKYEFIEAKMFLCNEYDREIIFINNSNSYMVYKYDSETFIFEDKEEKQISDINITLIDRHTYAIIEKDTRMIKYINVTG